MNAEPRTLAPFGRRQLAVTGREELGAYVVVSADDPAGPMPRAGQFYMLTAAKRWGGGSDERPFLPRAFSVMRAQRLGEGAAAACAGRAGAAADSAGHGGAADASAGRAGAADASAGQPAADVRLEFMLEAVGPGTERLCELGPGDAVLVTGPLGIGFRAPEDERRALLCGGGVGTAPLAIWQDELLARGQPAPALLGFRDADHAPGAALLHNPRVATDDGSHGHHGLVTDLLAAELDGDDAAHVYACGPPPMLEAVRRLCAERDVPCQLALESGMACGYGACFGCVVPLRAGGYIRLCVDGPVLEGSRLAEVPAH